MGAGVSCDLCRCRTHRPRTGTAKARTSLLRAFAHLDRTSHAVLLLQPSRRDIAASTCADHGLGSLPASVNCIGCGVNERGPKGEVKIAGNPNVSTPNPPNEWQPRTPDQPPRNPAFYGPPAHNYQQPPMQGNPPTMPWAQPPPPPQKSTLKWLLLTVAGLLVVAITIGATLLFVRDDEPGSSSIPTTPSDIASSGDTGPVSIPTSDPTCNAFISLNDSLVNLRMQGWGDQRANLGPSTSWTPEQRKMVDTVATATSRAADQMVDLAKQTPHRVVRELYEQFVAYGRAYAGSISAYQPVDNYLASVNVNIGDALLAICTSIENGAAGRTIAVEEAKSPTQVAETVNPADPTRLLTEPIAICSPWVERENSIKSELGAWSELDTNIAASEWTPEHRAIEEAAIPRLQQLGEETASAARESGNPLLEDFGTLSDLYLTAYASAGTTYVPADSWLSSAGLRLINIVTDACRAEGG